MHHANIYMYRMIPTPYGDFNVLIFFLIFIEKIFEHVFFALSKYKVGVTRLIFDLHRLEKHPLRAPQMHLLTLCYYILAIEMRELCAGLSKYHSSQEDQMLSSVYKLLLV